jgi:hypothetical protein
MKLLAVGLLLLAGCASTPRGQAIEGHAADVGTTAVALSQPIAGTQFAEMNPLGWAAIPLKAYMINRGKQIEDCQERREWYRMGSQVGWGAAGWNGGQMLAVAAGAGPVAIVGAGIVSAVSFVRWSGDRVPDCPIPDRRWDEDVTCEISECWSLDLWPEEIAQLEQFEWERQQ